MTKPTQQQARANECAEAVGAAREVLARWEAEHVAAQAELASLQQRAGVEVLDDAAAASALPRQMAELRDRVDIASRAITAQRPRVASAESTFLSAEADALEQAVILARRRRAEHQSRTDELLRELAKHEGKFEPARLAPLASHRLDREQRHAEIRVEILRRMAAGEDPDPWLQTQVDVGLGTVGGAKLRDLYPACVAGPDAVVTAPAFVREDNREARVRAEVDAEVSRLEEEAAAAITQLRSGYARREFMETGHVGRHLQGLADTADRAVNRLDAFRGNNGLTTAGDDQSDSRRELDALVVEVQAGLAEMAKKALASQLG